MVIFHSYVSLPEGSFLKTTHKVYPEKMSGTCRQQEICYIHCEYPDETCQGEHLSRSKSSMNCSHKRPWIGFCTASCRFAVQFTRNPITVACLLIRFDQPLFVCSVLCCWSDSCCIVAHLLNYMGLSENRVYSQLYSSHLIGIMIINHWV